MSEDTNAKAEEPQSQQEQPANRQRQDRRHGLQLPGAGKARQHLTHRAVATGDQEQFDAALRQIRNQPVNGVRLIGDRQLQTRSRGREGLTQISGLGISRRWIQKCREHGHLAWHSACRPPVYARCPTAVNCFVNRLVTARRFNNHPR